MIAYIQGELAFAGDGAAVVDCGGVGYEAAMSPNDLARLPAVGSPVRIYTFLNVNENTGVSLFGFLEPDDLAMFKLLITVSGIGPKGAQAILSVLPADVLRFAILSEDSKSIAKAPGIGAKTASKLVLELKDKVSLQEAFEKRLENVGSAAVEQELQGAKEDAVLALVALGYSKTEATRAVSSVPASDGMSVDELLRRSLKFL
ncbi:MAG: Holliday junction branch migration protein RuvA [Lachnospiraceae bacterium]|nr:Holliday junction branch migration protein RuvA [Lachnospiraceae bacterium]